MRVVWRSSVAGAVSDMIGVAHTPHIPSLHDGGGVG
jgi:hypothetical protein